MSRAIDSVREGLCIFQELLCSFFHGPKMPLIIIELGVGGFFRNEIGAERDIGPLDTRARRVEILTLGHPDLAGHHERCSASAFSRPFNDTLGWTRYTV